MTADYIYFPQRYEESREYLQFDISGLWSKDFFSLSILSQLQLSANTIITPKPYESPAFIGTAMVWLSVETTQNLGSLKNGIGISGDGRYYLGEGVNENDNVIHPPEAILSYKPFVGETIESHSRVFKSPTDNTVLVPDFHWKYKTINYFQKWGNYTDCWRTGLWEYNTNYVYNYIFSKNAGMVDFWYGLLNISTGTVSGKRFYMKPLATI